MLCLALFSGCQPHADTAALNVSVDYLVNGQDLLTDSMQYVNEADNHFMINEIQWFLSHLELQDANGTWTAIGEPEAIRYFDTHLPETHQIHFDGLPAGSYQALRFTFGLDENDNVTGRFPNPPEMNMFWPEPLGGGYHYMKLNGRWLNPEQELQPLNIHLGVGQNPELTEFYPNHFTVTLPINLTLKASHVNSLRLIMVIDNWFRGPNLFDFNQFGSTIMQNQEAQRLLKENGQDVFRVALESSLVDDIARPMKTIAKAASPKPHFYTKKNMGKLLSDLTRKKKKP